MKFGGLSRTLAHSWLREWESNPRPEGYEPSELPLLYPALKSYDVIPNRILGDIKMKITS